MAPPTIPIEQRFASKYEVDPETGCWLWTASIRPNGYAQFRYSKGKNGYGHRFAYEHFVGPIDDGLTIDHLCRNRACVNPDHLEPVTQQKNVLRGMGKGAANAVKTHCPEGHPYEGDNLYVNPKTKRRTCRACQRLYKDAHRDEIRAYQRDYMRVYARERYATDEAYREARKQQSRNQASLRRERYATDEAYREACRQQTRDYRAQLLADAKKWREAQKPS